MKFGIHNASWVFGPNPNDAFAVRHVPGDPNVWTVQTSYGETPGAMTQAIVAEWIDGGRRDPGLGDLWLATPQIANHPFKQQCHDRSA